ncbi:hypothetical protein ACTFIU_000804 [Dictyostelium citrinum]
MTSTVNSGSGSGKDSYFSEIKKSELGLIKNNLATAINERNADKIKEILQRIIYYMTIGMDVSVLFPDVIMVASSNDIIIKKLVYLYIVHYSKSNPDLLLLVVNTLRRDCIDRNPIIRGLALRSLCSLDSKNTLEYATIEINRSLTDFSGYVRKTALLGLAKLYHLSKEAFDLDIIIPKIFDMIMDQDPQVIVNAVSTLNEIRPGWSFTFDLVQHLMVKFKEFNEWSQCIILECLSRYTPSSEEESLDILNLLDDRLSHSNSALALSTIKIFLKYTDEFEEIQEQVYERIKEPLITLMENSESNETSFTILHHIHLLMSRSPKLFNRYYKHFYCKFDDPMYIKTLKVQVLKEIASNQTFIESIDEILQELSEYVYEGDHSLCRQSINAITVIAQKHKNTQEKYPIDDSVLEKIFLPYLSVASNLMGNESNNNNNNSINDPYQFSSSISINEGILSFILVSLKDFLRVFPKHLKTVLPYINENLIGFGNISNYTLPPSANESVLWMLGESPKSQPNSPYIIEEFFNEKFDQQPTFVKTQLLTTSLKVFFDRPGEMLPIIKKILIKCSDLSQDPGLHEISLFYSRTILLLDIDKAASIINSSKQNSSINTFLEDEINEYRDKIFDEFNTISVLFGKHSTKFIKNKQQIENEKQQFLENQKNYLLSITDGRQNNNQNNQNNQNNNNQNNNINNNNNNNNHGKQLLKEIESSPNNLIDTFILDQQPELSPELFQSLWLSLEDGHKIDIQLDSPIDNSEIESVMSKQGIMCLAFGSVDQQTKLYYYARQNLSFDTDFNSSEQQNEQPIFIIEILIDEKTLLMSILFKSPILKTLHNKFIPKFLSILSIPIPKIFNQ